MEISLVVGAFCISCSLFIMVLLIFLCVHVCVCGWVCGPPIPSLSFRSLLSLFFAWFVAVTVVVRRRSVFFLFVFQVRCSCFDSFSRYYWCMS